MIEFLPASGPRMVMICGRMMMICGRRRRMICALESVGRKSSLFPSRSIHVSTLISAPCILLLHYYYFICFIFFGLFRCTTFFHVNSPSRNQLLACMFSMFLTSLTNRLYFLLPRGIHIIKEKVQLTNLLKILLLLP